LSSISLSEESIAGAAVGVRMPKKKTDVATEIVAAIVADLNDRKGLGLDSLDDGIREEIEYQWRAIVRRHLTMERDL